eukprot:Blabericola_migrator_1__5286@NODE_2712_length_2436_cov_4_896159_g1697_i0_p1_GENE_NODE_2712_length_2436_cov_4_896159_g1697_i0NODE_2712_length_2436_cov_4_896159_g1697_i0_p1_ORF_typecomplete_len488_score63_27FAD_binding_4/PF01565_23/1_6e30BBE/PF08031_12/6e06_NODE_2712_length_2436_cov_4_896159_g1697_i0291492
MNALLRLVLALIISASLGFADDAFLKACLTSNSLTFKWRGDPGFENSITVLNKIWQSSPIAVVRVKSAFDASRAVVCANLDNRIVTARSGGHSYGGYSRGMNDGLVLDMRGMGNVSVDRVNEVVEFESGVRLGYLYTVLDEAGHYIVPGGSSPGVGAMGNTLGGGRGPLSPSFGMMSDNVVSMQVVLADGTITDIDLQHHPDLFWAMRGAGIGNFAVATKIRMKIHKVTQVSWRLYYPPETFGHVVGCAAPWTNVASTRVGLIAATEGNKVRLWALYLGSPWEMDRALSSLEHCIPSLKMAPTFESSSFLDVFALYNRVVHGKEFATKADIAVPPDYSEATNFQRTLNLEGRTWSPALGAVLDEYWAKAPSSGDIDFQYTGGMINSVPPQATAFHLRDATFSMAVTLHRDNDTLAPSTERWGDNFISALRAVVPRHYRNYNRMDILDTQHAGSEIFGENLPLLKYVAAKYDPNNRFAFPMSVANLNP